MNSNSANRFMIAASVAIALGLLASACTSATESESASGDEAECSYIDSKAKADIAEGMPQVLSGSESVQTDSPCIYRYQTDTDWVQIEFMPAQAEFDDTMLVAGSYLTNGRDRSRIGIAGSEEIDVVATASEPKAISTWDASLVGVGALAP